MKCALSPPNRFGIILVLCQATPYAKDSHVPNQSRNSSDPLIRRVILVRFTGQFCLLRRGCLEPIPFAPACRGPKVAKDTTRVEDCHGRYGDNNHRALENHEGDFVVGEVAGEAFPELRDTVDTSNENEDSGNEKTLT